MSEGTRNTQDGFASIVTSKPTRYEVTCLPEDNVNLSHYTITVEYRGENRWAVLNGRFCLGADGDWEYEPRPGSREDGWLDAHRFDFDTAMRLATKAAPHMTVNGYTVDHVLKQHAEGRGHRAR